MHSLKLIALEGSHFFTPASSGKFPKMNHRMILPCPTHFSSFPLQKSSFSSFVWMVGPDFIWPAETRQNEAALPAAVNAAGPPLIRDDADASRTCVRTRETHGDCKVRHQLTKDVVWKGVKVSSWALYLFSLKGFSCGVLELVADIPLELLREANDDSQTSFTSCLTAPSLWWIHVRWQIH